LSSKKNPRNNSFPPNFRADDPAGPSGDLYEPAVITLASDEQKPNKSFFSSFLYNNCIIVQLEKKSTFPVYQAFLSFLMKTRAKDIFDI